MNTTHLMVSSPRGTLTHLSRHGELTLCGRQVPATWLQEPCTAERSVSCDRCAMSVIPETMALRATRAHDAVQLEEPAPALPAHSENTTLLVVPCSGAKLDRPAPAAQLYRGTLTTMGLAACSVVEGNPETLTGHAGTRTMILSALHGLVDTDHVLAPYDVKMGDAGSITTQQLANQLTAAGATCVVALTPNDYTDALAAACELAGVQLVRAFDGCRGIGDQRGRLASLRRSGGYGPQWSHLGLETRRMVQSHLDALAEGRARSAEQDQLDATAVQLVRPEFALALIRRGEDLQPGPSCGELLQERRRTALRRQESGRRRGALARAVQNLPGAGTPRTC